MRDRLIDMVKESLVKHIDKTHMLAENITDHLLANGVIVPPCKVGDVVYVKWKLHRKSNYGIFPAKVYALRWDEKKNNFRVCVKGVFEISAYGGKYSHYYNGTFAWESIGKTVFLTKEEAEKALAGRSKQ